MTKPWLCRIELANCSRATAVRAEKGIDAAFDADFLWLRGSDLHDELKTKLQSIADGDVFLKINDKDLVPLGQSVPTETMPNLSWSPLLAVSRLLLPVAALPHGQVQRCKLRLIRSHMERPAELLVTTLALFAEWGLAAAEVRLQRCRFAVPEARGDSTEAWCVVTGSPLPTIQGQRFWVANQVAIPIGFEWTPAVDQTTLSKILANTNDGDSSSQDILLWRQDEQTSNESVCILPAQCFVRATRQSIRRLRGDVNDSDSSAKVSPQ